MDIEVVPSRTSSLSTVEPLAGWRTVEVTERRTTLDFAHQMQWLVDRRRRHPAKWLRTGRHMRARSFALDRQPTLRQDRPAGTGHRPLRRDCLGLIRQWLELLGSESLGRADDRLRPGPVPTVRVPEKRLQSYRPVTPQCRELRESA
jgi:hypothetical protein